MKKTLLLCTILLASCGKTEKITVENTIMETKISHDLDAVYYFDNGGSIEVSQDQYNRITLYQLDYLTSVNPQNDTLGEHPRTNITDKYLTLDNKILYSTNVNYSNGDLENDTSGANITGQHRTDFEYQFKDDKLYLTIKIYDSVKFSNVNYVIATRKFIGWQ